MVKKQQYVKYKKAPQAPRRFKSAYMFFSTKKHKEIREEVGRKKPTTEIAKMVSVAWKSLPPKEREDWDEMARRDKARYEVEKTMYTGPWKVPAKQRAQKDPSAPKRPMSAFLSFSNSKRAMVKQQNAGSGNAEVSRMLAKMWKEAPEDERELHITREFALRQEYKTAIAEWRENAGKELEDHRQKREEMALRAVDGVSEAGDYLPTSSVANTAYNNVGVAVGAQHGYGPSSGGAMGERLEYAQHPTNYEQDPEKNEDCAENSEQKNYAYSAHAPYPSMAVGSMSAHAPHAAGMASTAGAYPSAYPYSQVYPPAPYGGHSAYQPYYGSYGAVGASCDEQVGAGPATAPVPDGSQSYQSATTSAGYSYPAQTGYPPAQGNAYYQGYGQYPAEAYGSNANTTPQYYDNRNTYHHHHQTTMGAGNEASAPYYGYPAQPNDSTDTQPNLGYPHRPY